MGGAGAPGSLKNGVETQVWLATSDEKAADVSGQYFYLKGQQKPQGAALDERIQDAYLKACEELSGVKLPE